MIEIIKCPNVSLLLATTGNGYPEFAFILYPLIDL